MAVTSEAAEHVRIGLSGDVMLGRGVDQIQRHPGDPTIHEPWATSALRYVELAEAVSGPIPRAVDPAYVWGDLLTDLSNAGLDGLIVNLETAVTDRGRPWPGKRIQYRMHPATAECLTAAAIDVAVLANNHVLDWSEPGLRQTLEVVAGLGVRPVGAGCNEAEAWEPAVVDVASGSRLVVVAAGSTSSGIPSAWAAGADRAGVALLDGLQGESVDQVARLVRSRTDQAGDLVVMSLHWGGNWGYRIPVAHRRFAHQLIDEAGVQVVHGHSSHHPLGIEVYRGHLILYGCGDLITDYEGISGHEEYRGELGGLYVADVEPGSGLLRRLRVIPTRMRGLRLSRPSFDDVAWFAAMLDREGAKLGTAATVDEDGYLTVHW
ncbi:MAG: CapA family protein [Acidimicrobiia bacterium]|nr:CapA family protein [Acidimicrobiia bacterium]